MLVGPLALAAGDGARYRVTGIIDGAHNQLAVVEKSDDTQHLFRVGDTIDQYSIASIETHGIYLRRGAQEFYLELRGEPQRLEDLVAVMRTQDLQVSDGTATMSVDLSRAEAELARLSRTVNHSNGGRTSRQGLAGASSSRGAGSDSRTAGNAGDRSSDDQLQVDDDSSKMTLAEQLNAALGLPTFTVIRAVDRDIVSSAAEAYPLIMERISNGRIVRLDVGGSIPGVETLYVSGFKTPVPAGP